MIFFTSSFEIINFFILDWKIFSWVPVSGADAAAAYPIGINIILTSDVSNVLAIDKPISNNCSKSLQRNLNDWLF